MKKVIIITALSVMASMAYAQDKVVVDGGHSASRSFDAQSAMLKDNYGIELSIPQGFVDRTFGTSKVYTISNQPETRTGSMYVSCVSLPDMECAILYEDYVLSSRRNKAVNLYPQDWLMREELGVALALEQDPERVEQDFRKVIMDGEGLSVDDSDILRCVKEIDGSGGASVAYFMTELTPRADAVFRRRFLCDKSEAQVYTKCNCVYFLLPNGVCHSAKIFMTDKAVADAVKYLDALVAASSYKGLKDESKASREGDILFSVYSSELYKGESDKVYGQNRRARESIVASMTDSVFEKRQ